MGRSLVCTGSQWLGKDNHDQTFAGSHLSAHQRSTAEVLGKPVGDQQTRRYLGYLPEETYLYRFLNARQTLDFYARIFNLNRVQRARAVDHYLDFVGLDPAVRNRPLRTYSKGQARRVGLAQALLNDPDLVILDEPTSGLDPIGTLEMKELILQLKRAGKTVLLSSHQLADVEDVCDRVCILYRGIKEVEGTVDELLEVKDVFKLEARNVPESVQQQMVAARCKIWRRETKSKPAGSAAVWRICSNVSFPPSARAERAAAATAPERRRTLMVTLQALLAQFPAPGRQQVVWHYRLVAPSGVAASAGLPAYGLAHDVYRIFFRAKDMGTGLAAHLGRCPHRHLWNPGRPASGSIPNPLA